MYFVLSLWIENLHIFVTLTSGVIMETIFLCLYNMFKSEKMKH